MENYSWDKKDLIFRKKKIKLLLLNSNLETKERALLENYLKNVEEMLWDLDNIKFNLGSVGTLLLPVNKKIKLFYDQIDAYTTNFQNEIILNSYYIFEECENTYNNKTGEKELSFEDQKELISLLYSFNDTSKEMVEKIFNSNNHLLNFNNSNQNIFYNVNNKKYINLNYKNNIKSYLCLSHELGHNYESLIEKNSIPILNDKYTNYFEMFSLFFEHLSVDNLLKEKVINEDDRKDIMNDISACNTQDMYYYLLFLIAKGDKFDFREKFQIKGITKPLTWICQYYYSYIIAINMYYKYLNDPEHALYLMEYICNNFEENKEEAIIEYCDIDLTHDIIKKHLDNIKTKNN